MADNDLVELATELTVAWLANPHTRVAVDEVQPFLASIHAALSTLGKSTPRDEPTAPHTPAVSARRSLASPEKIISMIDGKPYSSLTRHLRTHGLTPDQYRKRYELKADYPMVAPAYSKRRSSMAKQFGLGRKAAESVAEVAGAPTAARDITAAKRGAKDDPQASED